MFRVNEYIKDAQFNTPGDSGYLRKHAIRYLANGGYAAVAVSVGQILSHRDGITKLDSIVVNYLVDGELPERRAYTVLVDNRVTDLMILGEMLQFMRDANVARENGVLPQYTTLVFQF